MADEDAVRRTPTRNGTRARGEPKPAPLPALGEPVRDRGQADDEEREAEPVERPGFLGAAARGGGEARARPATMPIGRLTKKIQRQPACSTSRPPSDGAEDGGEHHRDADRAEHAAHVLWTGGAGEDDLADRHQHAAAEALEDAEDDQRVDRPREAAEHRAEREEDE